MASSKKRKPKTPSSKRRIRITPVFRDPIDVDKLAQALLRLASQINEREKAKAKEDDKAA